MSQQNEQPVQNEQPQEQQFQQQNVDFPQGEDQMPLAEEKGGLFSYLKKHPMRVILLLLIVLALVFGALYMFKPSLVQSILKMEKKIE